MSSTDSQPPERRRETPDERWIRMEIQLLRTSASEANTRGRVWLHAAWTQRAAGLERVSRELYS
jgi:hypothetical protein